MIELTTLVANVESVGSDQHPIGAALVKVTRKREPDVVTVLQAYNAREWLRELAEEAGYKHRQYVGREASGIAVLVRRGVKIRERRALVMKRRWQGPPSKGGRWHDPRTYPALVLEKEDQLFRELGVHLPTFNNPVAQAESLDAIARWLRAGGVGARKAAGDFNRKAEQLEATARAAEAQLIPSGKVDHALSTGGRTFGERVVTPRGAHGWTIYTQRNDRKRDR